MGGAGGSVVHTPISRNEEHADDGMSFFFFYFSFSLLNSRIASDWKAMFAEIYFGYTTKLNKLTWQKPDSTGRYCKLWKALQLVNLLFFSI